MVLYDANIRRGYFLFILKNVYTLYKRDTFSPNSNILW